MARSFSRRTLFSFLLVTLCTAFPLMGVLCQSADGADGASSKAAAKDKDVYQDYPLGDVSRWLPHAKSFRLRGEVRDETGPEKIAANLRGLKARFPGSKDPDPNQFTELLPVRYTSVDYAFDRTRTRFVQEDRTDGSRILSRHVGIWDGKVAAMHDEYPPAHQNYFGFDSKPHYGVMCMFSYSTYLSRQPPIFWWKSTPEAKKAFQASMGTPADFIRVAREKYHGVDCDVLLNSAGNGSDRYYLGAGDGRWYGAKEGVIGIADVAVMQKSAKGAIEEFLGKTVDDRELYSAELGKKLLRQDNKVAWLQVYYKRIAKDFVPVAECWFSDYRDVGNGRVFPYREDLLFHNFDRETKKFSVGTKRTFVVKEIAIDRPLDDNLFHEPLVEGAEVSDLVHQPFLCYKYKAKFTPAEWQKILKQAEDRDKGEKLGRQRAAKLIGKPAPALPTGPWINSKPLAWADLRGKIVVLKFWSIGCGPCYNEIDALSGHYEKDEDEHYQEGDRAKLVPLLFIGVHAPGNSREEIEKVLKKRKLAAPICIDHAEQGESPWGEFFAKCAVDRMPTTMAVDEGGRILAYGDFGDVMEKVRHHRDEAPAKK